MTYDRQLELEGMGNGTGMGMRKGKGFTKFTQLDVVKFSLYCLFLVTFISCALHLHWTCGSKMELDLDKLLEPEEVQ